MVVNRDDVVWSQWLQFMASSCSAWCHCGMEFTGCGRGVVGCGIVDMVGKRVMRVYWGWNGSREDNKLDINIVITYGCWVFHGDLMMMTLCPMT